MPHKNPAERRKYHAQYMRKVWYPKNKKKHLKYIQKLKNLVRAYIENYKKQRKCADCGFLGKHYPQVLDFDHLSHKVFAIGSWRKNVLSVARVEKEIKKCELVCANCHRIRTVKRLFKSKRLQ